MKKILMPLAFALLLATTVFAGRIEKATERVAAEDAKYVDIDGDLGAGEFRIRADDIGELAVFDIEYNKHSVDYTVDYYERGDKGFLTFESDHDNHGDFDENKNKWDIVLSTKYESFMSLDIGAADADMDLGGLPLKGLSIDIGAASGDIRFSKPNPIRMKKMSVDAGASSLDMTMIGNANFEYFDFSGGVGSFDLDFRGKYEGESEVSIEIGLGSADIIFPTDVPIMIESNGNQWLSSIDFHGDYDVDMDEHDGRIKSKGFDQAKTRIYVRLNVGLGSIDVYWKN